MQHYSLPLISLCFIVIALGLCLRSLFTRRFYLWILPLLLTVGLGVFTFLTFLPAVSARPVEIRFGIAGNPLVLYIFDFLWLLQIASFIIYINKTDGMRRIRRNRNEYEYLKPKNRKDISRNEF